MLLNVIGGLMVFGASTFLGFYFSGECGRRPNELRELQSLLQIFENEITFLSNLLTDAFQKIQGTGRSEVCRFFRDTVAFLKEDGSMGASAAWRRAVSENIRRTALDKEDAEILLSFGHLLGNSDLEGQIKNIRLTLHQLKLQEQKAEEKKKKNEAMYRTLGILGGLAVVIVLF